MKTTFIGPHGSWKARFLYTALRKEWPESGVTPLVAGERFEKLELWETSGKPEKRDERLAICKGSNLFVYCFNSAKADALSTFNEYYEECLTQCPNVPIVLLGNKTAQQQRIHPQDVASGLDKAMPILYCDDVADQALVVACLDALQTLV